MRHMPLILTVAATLALLACNPSSPPNASAGTDRNVAAPAAPAAAPAPTDAGNGSSGNGLWGVSEAEDEASHRGVDFIAFNRTGRAVTSLSVRPYEGPLDPGVQETPWSANVLSQSELPDGQRAAAHYEADIELCRWQLRATYADRTTRDYPSVNLCETIRVDLR